VFDEVNPPPTDSEYESGNLRITTPEPPAPPAYDIPVVPE
jgi:hypothetical protein